MNEFLIRLRKSVFTTLTLIITTVFMLIIALVIIGVILFLPVWVLSFLIGDNAYYWIILALITFPIIAEWNTIIKWLKWQFIEPFKK
ncbi:hypothetical protein CWO92_18255 [Heyndrickxia camelliae]|uniref:Uncharacterized protein n=2 Tax=Heyndrickxia camelliae TaxID=1707093 RepID=A0A2N3LFW0_9BACI|nr:hypothetical protein CWO92_18255 [Heyndrickxia camelliae]